MSIAQLLRMMIGLISTILVVIACSGNPVPKPPLPDVGLVGSQETNSNGNITSKQPLSVKPETTVLSQDAESLPNRSVQIVLATSDLGIGMNRVAFAMIDSVDGVLTDVEVEVQSFRLAPEGSQGPVETKQATYREWPVSPGGIFTTLLKFDEDGHWGLAVTAEDADGVTRNGNARLNVKIASDTPNVGSPAPRSVSKTANNLTDMSQLTSDLNPDPELYSVTIAESLDGDRPLVVAFVTPAYCQTATCGPQLDVIKNLKEKYKDRVDFVHIEIYDNPHEIQGDLAKAKLTPTVLEWNLPSEPWTFVIDSTGIIKGKFEGFTTKNELEQALLKVL